MNKLLNPKIPRPTTPSPITDPPANATSRALPSEVRAAFVVLTFAFVATRIPRNPASPEHKAPTINDNATKLFDSASSDPFIASNIASDITKIDKMRYSAFRNAIAPLLMFSAIFTIFSLPESCLLTQADFHITNKIAIILKTGKIKTKFCIKILDYYFK